MVDEDRTRKQQNERGAVLVVPLLTFPRRTGRTCPLCMAASAAFLYTWIRMSSLGCSRPTWFTSLIKAGCQLLGGPKPCCRTYTQMIDFMKGLGLQIHGLKTNSFDQPPFNEAAVVMLAV